MRERQRRFPFVLVTHVLLLVVGDGDGALKDSNGIVAFSSAAGAVARTAPQLVTSMRCSTPAADLQRPRRAGGGGRQYRLAAADPRTGAHDRRGATSIRQDDPPQHFNEEQQEPEQQDAWSSAGWAGERNGRPPSSGGEAMVGSPEFVSLVKAQFEVLATVLGADRVVLYARRENTDTGSLEFVPAMEYPERPPPAWSMDIDGVQMHEQHASSELLLPAAAEQEMNADSPDAVEGGDGDLSAPIMYSSLVLGMITVFKNGNDDGEARPPSAGEISASRGSEEARVLWDERDKRLLETIARSVGVAAVLDQKQRWAAVMQVEPLRKVVAESLHQVKNPMTALRTFGKLLLRRLPQDDTLNRELAKDIILQSDRLVDILLPVDAVLGLLATAIEREREAQMPGMVDPHAAQREDVAATAAAAAAATATAAAAAAASSAMDSTVEGVQDALLSPPAPTGMEETVAYEMMPFGLLSVEDVIQPVTRAAQAAAKERRVGFRWRVDQDLPEVVGDERALEEALSNVVENALKFCKMGRGEGGKDGGVRATVVLRARLSAEPEWGAESGVVIEVVDNGPGIEAEDMPYVFDRGYRGRQPLQCGIPGTGLGLGIARDTMRSFGGDLEVVNMKRDADGDDDGDTDGGRKGGGGGRGEKRNRKRGKRRRKGGGVYSEGRGK
ncbi:unnamed protein product [Ectocarpus fasciculatus]